MNTIDNFPAQTTFPYFQTGAISAGDLLIVDCNGFSAISIQANSIGTSGVIIPAFSNDNVNYTNTPIITPAGASASTISAAGFWTCAVLGRYLRLRLTTPTSGATTSLTVQGIPVASSVPTATSSSMDANLATIAANTGRIPVLGFAAPTAAAPTVFANDLIITGPAGLTSGNNILASDSNSSTDVGAYHSGLLAFTTSAGISGGVLTFEQSVDGATWVLLQVIDITNANTNPVTNLTLAASTTRAFTFAAYTAFIRVRVSTGITGGTVQARAVLSQQSYGALTLNVQQATAANLNATVTATNLSCNVAQLAGTTPVTAGVAGTLAIGGNIAHSSPSTSNPINMGGVVATTVDTTLVAGDLSRAAITTAMQQSVKPYGLPETDWQFTGVITSATATAARTAGAAGVRNYVTGIVYQNTSATASEIQIQDGATAIFRAQAPASMVQPASVSFATPLRGTAATALNVQLITTGTNTFVNLQGYQAA